MVRRYRGWLVSLAGVGVLIVLSTLFADRQIVINTSDSMPHGLYVRSNELIHVGCIVDFVIPESARPYLQTRTGNPGSHWYLLKPIVAGPGDWVDTTGNVLLINGVARGPIAHSDAAGRLLPHWRERRCLADGEFFAVSDRVSNSFDSRYFGPIRQDQIAAVRKALLTW